MWDILQRRTVKRKPIVVIQVVSFVLLKAVELEIQKIEASQAKRHVQLLTAFLPESFVRRGGDLSF